MSIIIISTRVNDGDQTVFFTLSVPGEDNPVEFHADCPKEEEAQEYLGMIEDYLVFLALNKMYREADWARFKIEENTKLEAMQAWVADGHKNKIVIGETKAGKPKYAYKVIKKKKWRSTHPPYIKALKKIEASDVSDEVKELLAEIIAT